MTMGSDRDDASVEARDDASVEARGDASVDALVDALRAVVGAAHVLVDGDLEAYVVDWRKRWRGMARAVVRPASTDEVAAVVRKAATRVWWAAACPMAPARRCC
jgi:hypothetical protein